MQTLKELLSVQWTKYDGSVDEKMVEYGIKSSIYIQSGDDFIDVGDAKPAIKKTMWFDDETKGPEVSFESFKRYNMPNAPSTITDQLKVRNRKPYIVNQYYQRPGRDTSHLKTLVFRNVNIDRLNGDERPATDEEIKLITKAIAKARADYELRLQRYWKRYGKHVHASGYWANR